MGQSLTVWGPEGPRPLGKAESLTVISAGPEGPANSFVFQNKTIERSFSERSERSAERFTVFRLVSVRSTPT